jgi:hypothetical protein
MDYRTLLIIKVTFETGKRQFGKRIILVNHKIMTIMKQ